METSGARNGACHVREKQGKSNVLSHAAKSFVTWDREAVYNFVLHERHADAVESVSIRFQKWVP